MTRILLAATFLAAAACSPAVQAQSAVLYGLLDVSGARIKPVGGQRSWQLDSGDMARSFLGLRGAEDLGGGLKAVWKLESYVRADTGSVGRTDGDAFWAREASVGLSGAFGTTVLGRNPSPLWLSITSFNPFGESIAFSPTVRQYYGGTILGDTRWNNSISYTNNPGDALRINFASNADETTPGDSNGHNIGLGVSYINGPFAVSVVGQRVKNSPLPLPAGFEQQTVVHIGATYDFKFVRLYGQAGRIKTEGTTDAKTALYQLGAAVPFGTSLVLAAYGRSRTTTPLQGIVDSQASIAYDYFLSKNTDVYVAGLYEKRSFVSSGNGVAAGLRTRF